MIREYQPRLFMMINFRPIAEDTCNEEWTGNMTRLVPGSYEWRDVGERGITCNNNIYIYVYKVGKKHGIKVKPNLIIFNVKNTLAKVFRKF